MTTGGRWSVLGNSLASQLRYKCTEIRRMLWEVWIGEKMYFAYENRIFKMLCTDLFDTRLSSLICSVECHSSCPKSIIPFLQLGFLGLVFQI